MAQKKKILIIEDEAGLALTLTDRLTSEGYTVTHVADGEKGEETATKQTFDVGILDVMLPKKNGFDVLRDLRKNGVTTPILILTARGQVHEKVLGLKLGADDYLPKPFEMLELLARIESLLRRPALRTEHVMKGTYSFGSVTVNFKTFEVKRKGKLIELTAREFQLLKFFIHHRGEVVTREQILNDIWGYDAMPTTRTVDTHVTWLRQKIEENPKTPCYLLTVHGVGYKFVG